MSYGHNVYERWLIKINNREGETAENEAPCSIRTRRPTLWSLHDADKGISNSSKKIYAGLRTSITVPSGGFSNFDAGFRIDRSLWAHQEIRRLIPGQPDQEV